MKGKPHTIIFRNNCFNNDWGILHSSSPLDSFPFRATLPPLSPLSDNGIFFEQRTSLLLLSSFPPSVRPSSRTLDPPSPPLSSFPREKRGKEKVGKRWGKVRRRTREGHTRGGLPKKRVQKMIPPLDYVIHSCFFESQNSRKKTQLFRGRFVPREKIHEIRSLCLVRR